MPCCAYSLDLRTLAALGFDANDADAAIRAISDLALRAQCLERVHEARALNAYLLAALSLKHADPRPHQIALFRRALALAPSLCAPLLTARIRHACDVLEALEQSANRRRKLHETYKAIDADAEHLTNLPENEQREVLERYKRVTSAAEKEQRRLTRISHGIFGRMPRVLRLTKVRPRARRSARRARRATPCRRQQTDSGGSEDGAGDPPPDPAWGSIVEVWGAASVRGGPRRISLRPHASAAELCWSRSSDRPRRRRRYPDASGDAMRQRDVTLAAAEPRNALRGAL